jgi:hypothetical protein
MPQPIASLHLRDSFRSYVCMYVCIETRAEGPNDLRQVSERSGLRDCLVLRKNHVFEEHAACS